MKKNTKSFGGAVAAGSALAGAALGAAAVVLSDKKNQQKIKRTIDDISHDAVQLGKDIKKKADTFRKGTKKVEKKVERKATKKASSKKRIAAKK